MKTVFLSIFMLIAMENFGQTQAEMYRQQLSEIEKVLNNPDLPADEKAQLREVLNQVKQTIGELETDKPKIDLSDYQEPSNQPVQTQETQTTESTPTNNYSRPSNGKVQVAR